MSIANVSPVSASEFDRSLAATLALYTSPEAQRTESLYQTTREVAIARFALENQAKTYAAVISFLHSMLEDHIQSNNQDSGFLGTIFNLVNVIESKSQRLIQSVKEVTAILGNSASIDIDRANLHSLLLSLPSLLRECIDDQEQATLISNRLQSRIEQTMASFRFDAKQPGQSAFQEQATITIDEYMTMIASVPATP